MIFNLIGASLATSRTRARSFGTAYSACKEVKRRWLARELRDPVSLPSHKTKTTNNAKPQFAQVQNWAFKKSFVRRSEPVASSHCPKQGTCASEARNLKFKTVCISHLYLFQMVRYLNWLKDKITEFKIHPTFYTKSEVSRKGCLNALQRLCHTIKWYR